jgi:hypothetical protein
MFDKPVRITPRTWEEHDKATARINNEIYEPRQRRIGQFYRPSGVGGAFPAVVNSAITPFNANTNTYGFGGVDVDGVTFNSNTNTYNASLNQGFNTNTLCLSNFENNGANINSGTRIQVFSQYGYLWYAGGDC